MSPGLFDSVRFSPDSMTAEAPAAALPLPPPSLANPWGRGVLCVLSTHGWGGRLTLPAATLRAMAEQQGSNPRWLKGGKVLVDPTALEPANAIRAIARSYLMANALPFPLRGVAFVPLDLVARVDARLKEIAGDLAAAAEEIWRGWQPLKREAQAELGPLYDETDYPSDVRKVYALKWTWLNIAAPAESMKDFAPAAYEEGKAKFLATMEEARGLAVAALREEFAEFVNRAVDRLESGKIFRDTLVGNFTEFFETFKARNVWDDAALTELVEQAKKALGNATPSSL